MKPVLHTIEPVGVADLGAQGLVPRPSFTVAEVQSPAVDSICAACGGYHGSVRKEVLCLRSAVVTLRSERDAARAEADRWR